MSSRGARVARGFTAAGVATLVAALFHMAGGGAAPSAVALTLSLTFSALASVALAGKRLALWRLSASVVLSQFLFHALFALSPAATFSGMPASGHLHAGMHLTVVSSGSGSAFLAADDAGMWMSHLAAALLTIAVLRHGERTLGAVCAFTFFALRRVFDRAAAILPRPFGMPSAIVESVPVTLPPLAVVIGRLRHRGPPSGIVPAG
jgi:hypothetical protein